MLWFRSTLQGGSLRPIHAFAEPKRCGFTGDGFTERSSDVRSVPGEAGRQSIQAHNLGSLRWQGHGFHAKDDSLCPQFICAKLAPFPVQAHCLWAGWFLPGLRIPNLLIWRKIGKDCHLLGKAKPLVFGFFGGSLNFEKNCWRALASVLWRGLINWNSYEECHHPSRNSWSHSENWR